MTVLDAPAFTPVCALAAVPPEEGRAALLPDGTAVAVFRLHDGTVRAVGNLDPATGAPVVCHGIVGDRGGEPTVASPLGKEVYSLDTGRCLDDPGLALPVHRAAVTGGVIHVSTRGNTDETGATSG